MKFTLTWLLSLLALPVAGHAQLHVVATLPDLADIARAIGGEHVTVTAIGKPAEDPHHIQPKPSYIVALNRADVLIENGLDLEIGWLPALLDQTRNAKIRAGAPGRIDASVGVLLLEIPAGPVDRSQGDVHSGGNPHFLLDPVRGKIVAQRIAAKLSQIAPAHTAVFQSNLVTWAARADAALDESQRLLAPYRGCKVVTYHKSLSYFAERFGLKVVGTIEPKPGIPPSPAQLTAVIALMQQEVVQLILQEPWHDRRTAELVASKSGAKLIVLPTQTGAPGTTDYASVGLAAARLIATALK